MPFFCELIRPVRFDPFCTLQLEANRLEAELETKSKLLELTDESLSLEKAEVMRLFMSLQALELKVGRERGKGRGGRGSCACT